MLYTSLHFSRVAPQVDPAMQLIALDWVAALAFSWAIWGPQRSLESIWRPRTRKLDPGSLSKLIAIFILNFFGVRDRCISSYFWGANAAPWVRAQRKQISCAPSRCLQLASVDSLYASKWTSSTKPPTYIGSLALAHSSRSGALKNRNSTGEIGKP